MHWKGFNNLLHPFYYHYWCAGCFLNLLNFHFCLSPFWGSGNRWSVFIRHRWIQASLRGSLTRIMHCCTLAHLLLLCVMLCDPLLMPPISSLPFIYCPDISQLVHGLIHRLTWELFAVWVYYEWSCCGHLGVSHYRMDVSGVSYPFSVLWPSTRHEQQKGQVYFGSQFWRVQFLAAWLWVLKQVIIWEGVVEEFSSGDG